MQDINGNSASLKCSGVDLDLVYRGTIMLYTCLKCEVM